MKRVTTIRMLYEGITSILKHLSMHFKGERLPLVMDSHCST
ncbi:hypothetical protein C1A50_4029 [Paenibacillus polymyxa]|nr:hypothetical protein C1A50_4029 [Paenibacillus polymyxa]